MSRTHDIGKYQRDGFLVIEGVLSAGEVAALRRVTDEFLERARGVSGPSEIYDFEDGHRPEAPRVRRLVAPHRRHPVYAALIRHPGIVDTLRQVIGPNIRFDNSKLNVKGGDAGAAVEWHQDWAFYPHTNQDLAAVGIMLDDCDLDNGPLLVMPGSHRGPIHDHHANGRFCGAIDPTTAGIDFMKAATLVGRAGSITVHHARAVHGSATNVSGRPRRVIFHQYRAADAWPLLGVTDFAAWEANMVCGTSSLEARMENVPVRMPLPPADNPGSIYENQRALNTPYFADVPAATATRI
jgi:ectoine hydroxylase-related dioxygenase (phytanoyl-CoA dioxygenase family)